MRFKRFKDTSKDYFVGKALFAPTNSEIEYLIQADDSGPTVGQKEFYASLQNNFHGYEQKLKPLIEDGFRNWKEDFTIVDFNKEFILVCITIPRLEAQPLAWDMAFTTVHNLNHHVTIDFVNDEPTGILIDG